MPQRIVLLLFLCIVYHTTIHAQVLTLKEAMNLSLQNYGTIKAKSSYIESSNETLKQTRRDYLPNVVLSAQQDYGTVNGQNGPLYGYGGYSVASSGLPLAQQNWNAGFGALYLANVNWDFFTFGRTRQRINISKAALQRDREDLEQEQFQHQIKVAAAYLNLLAAQRITLSQEKNLDRAQTFKRTAVTRAANGLIAGVDSTFASAEVSNAKIALIKAKDQEQEQASRLAVLIGMPVSSFVLDSTFISKIPLSIADTFPSKESTHPVLQYYQSRIDWSNRQVSYFKRSYFPTLSLFGVVQSRGSGFDAGYTQNQNAYTQDYLTGINPVRSNFLIGVGMFWNLTTIVRATSQVKSQEYISKALKDEYDLADQQIEVQSGLADQKIKNAMDTYREVPIQLTSATNAYQQKSTLYKNGLSNLVEVTQTLYILNRAETDRDIAYSNVWQALLLKAAAAGDLELFIKELN